jgi:large subunit ribosomal protein L18
MARNNRYSLHFRRRRKGITNYQRRLALVKSGVPRLVVRRTSNNIVAQVVEYDSKGDKILASAVAGELRAKYDWKRGKANTPCAYLTGYLAGKRAVDSGVKEAVLDIGLNAPTKGAKVFAVLKGALDAGLYIEHSDGILPDDDRTSGKFLGDEVAKEFDVTLKKLGGHHKESLDSPSQHEKVRADPKAKPEPKQATATPAPASSPKPKELAPKQVGVKDSDEPKPAAAPPKKEG